MTAFPAARWILLGLTAAFLASSACSGKGNGSAATAQGTAPNGDDAGAPFGDDAAMAPGDQGAGPAGDDAAAAVTPTAPGYPRPGPGGYGRSARSGTTPGDIIENFKFLGYRDGVIAPATQALALSDYYDPCGKKYKLIHLTVAAVWCTPCNQETDAIVAAKAQLDAQGVAVVQALDDGPVLGTGATVNDLKRWITSHGTHFTEMLDPNLTNLGGFFNAAAVPWNCDIDPRTMEILNASTGWAGDVATEMAPALSAVARPPLYPIGVSCP